MSLPTPTTTPPQSQSDQSRLQQSLGQQPARTTRRFNLVSASLAFLMWGAWAWHVNTLTPGVAKAAPWVSALTQGVGSFLITIIMVQIVARLYNHFRNHPLGLVLPTLITVAFTGSTMAIAHLAVGTPDVLKTITPGMTVAVFFNLYTTFVLSRTVPEFASMQVKRPKPR